jgi:hypothetical protein
MKRTQQNNHVFMCIETKSTEKREATHPALFSITLSLPWFSPCQVGRTLANAAGAHSANALAPLRGLDPQRFPAARGQKQCR